MTHKYIAHNDPGHGWLAVKRAELKDLGIAGQITLYSYQRGDTVYLEEDCDATLFIDAYKAKYGTDPVTEDHYSNGSSPIRSYAAYVPELDDLKPYIVHDVNTLQDFIDKYDKRALLDLSYFQRWLDRHQFVPLYHSDSVSGGLVVFAPSLI